MNLNSGVSPQEMESLLRFAAKASPPPLLYRYRRASEWTIKELSVPEVHISGVEDMNDPFEYRAPLRVDINQLKESFCRYCIERRGMNPTQAKQEAACVDSESAALLHDGLEALRADSGLICCSSDPRSNRMWSYYGDGHKGVCIGYASKYWPFLLAQKVAYADPSDSIDLLETLEKNSGQLAEHVSCRKGAEWAFEQEFRIPVGQIPKGHTRLLAIEPSAIEEIRLGARICPAFKEQVVKLCREMPHRPRIIQMDCDYNSFRLTESIL